MLEKEFLDWNELADLIPLALFENLRNLTAINNNIETIEPIANLSDIKYICLDGNKLTSIKFN